MTYKTQTIRYYDAHAQKMKLEGRLFRIKEQLSREAIKKDSIVLDAGCGNGELTIPLAKHCKEIIGVDLSPGMIKELSSRLKKNKIKNCRAIVGDLEKLPLQNNEVDVVLSFSTLYYIKDLSKVLREFRRVTKPGGVMILELFNARSMESGYSKKHFDVPQFHYTLEEYRQLCAKHNLNIKRIVRIQVVPNVLVRKPVEHALGWTIGKKTVDEWLSSAPLLRRYAMKFIMVVEKQ